MTVLTSSTCGAFSAVDEAYKLNPYSKVTDPTLSASHLEGSPPLIVLRAKFNPQSGRVLPFL